MEKIAHWNDIETLRKCVYNIRVSCFIFRLLFLLFSLKLICILYFGWLFSRRYTQRVTCRVFAWKVISILTYIMCLNVWLHMQFMHRQIEEAIQYLLPYSSFKFHNVCSIQYSCILYVITSSFCIACCCC